MQILKYLPLAFAALAIATPTSSKASKPDANKIVADIGVIRQMTNILHQTVTPFQVSKTGLIQALKINSAGNDVQKAIKDAIKDAKAAAPFNEDEALSVGVAVLDLNPDVISTLDTFKEKRPVFDHYHLVPIVRLTLKNQRKSTKELGDTITAKVPDSLKDLATSISQGVLDKFDELIAYYN